MRQHRILCTLLVVLALFAGCKGESPTAPSPTPTPGGGTTPPTAANVVVTVSNPNPLTGSTTVITATVTQNNTNVPDGTAVEFSTSFGTFTDTGARTTIRTTTNGVATATLTSGAAGTATVQVVVANVVRTTTITFSPTPVGPPPPVATTPTISSVVPNVGKPEGNETITITGTNFRQPIRVVFDFANGQAPTEAFVASLTPTQLKVVTPKVNLGPDQTQAATIRVIVDAGTPTEAVATAAFTFMPTILTPSIVTVSPDSGPASGGTRITIFGSGFQDPVQVFFGISPVFVQAQVINVTFDQIIVISPTSRDIAPATTGPVSIRVVNIKSATEVVAANVFRYAPALSIAGYSPNRASAIGGDRIVIDGFGFEGPVAVTLAGIQAIPIDVSGTRLVVRAGGLISPCGGATGPVVVTNLNTQDVATSADLGPGDPGFIYLGVNPQILSITSGGPIVPGSSISVTVVDPGVGINGSAIVRFTIGGTNVVPSPNLITNGSNQVFTVVVPATGFAFPTVACTTAAATPGTQLGLVQVDINFTNVTTGCTTTLTGGLTVNPPGANTCQSPPTATVAPTGVAPNCANAGNIVAVGAATGNATITVSNAAGSRDLTITGVTATAQTNITTITVNPVAPPTITIPGGGSQMFTVTVDPTAAGAANGTVTFTTNDPLRGTISVCVTANGT